MSDDARCVCGAPVSIAPCEGCGHPLKIQGRVFGVCARPDCVGEIHVSRNPVRYKDALPPAVAEVLRTGEPSEAMKQAAFKEFRLREFLYDDFLYEHPEVFTAALRAALAVLREEK